MFSEGSIPEALTETVARTSIVRAQYLALGLGRYMHRAIAPAEINKSVHIQELEIAMLDDA